MDTNKDIKLPILPTTVIGSYPRPRWLRKTIKLYKQGRIGEKELNEAFNDAVTSVVREQEIVGVDIPSDGEMRRDEMVEYFAERIEGFKFYGPVRVWGNNFFNKPAVVGEIKRTKSITVDEFLYLNEVTTRDVVKFTITGPYTIADWSYNEYYRDKIELASKIASIINQEVRELQDNGAKFIQIDEPALTTHPEEVEWAVDIVNEVTKGVHIKLGLHVCYSDYITLSKYFDRLKYDQLALEFANRGFRDLDILRKLNDIEIGLGVIDVHNRSVEEESYVQKAIEKAMKYVRPEKIYINPDCGLKLLPRETARRKLQVMVSAARRLRNVLAKKGYSYIVL